MWPRASNGNPPGLSPLIYKTGTVTDLPQRAVRKGLVVLRVTHAALTASVFSAPPMLPEPKKPTQGAIWYQCVGHSPRSNYIFYPPLCLPITGLEDSGFRVGSLFGNNIHLGRAILATASDPFPLPALPLLILPIFFLP